MADNKKTEATEETVAPETTVDTNVNTDETQVPDSIGLADLQILEQKFKAYEYYIDAIQRDGVPYELITKVIPIIEEEVNDILAQIVDLSTQRGAFRGNELTQVGAVYDKLTTFLNYVAEANAEKEAEQGAEATAETPAEEPASA